MIIGSRLGTPECGTRRKRKSGEECQFPFTGWRVTALVTILLSTLATSSCVDLTEISKFAKSSQDIGNNFKALAADTAAACRSAANFSPSERSPLNCDRYTQLEPALAKVNDALFAYISSLGKLGAVDLPKAPFSSVPAELQQADPTISAAQLNEATAASGLANAVTKLVMSGYKQHTLARIIHENNSSVQVTTSFLSDYAAGKLEQVLNDTWTLEEQYCTSNRNRLGPKEPLAAQILAWKCGEDKAGIDAKLAAVESFKKALATIATTHETLDKHRNSWGAKELEQDIGPQISSLTVAALSMQTAIR